MPGAEAALPDRAARELYVRIMERGGRITLAEAAADDSAALAGLLTLGLLEIRPDHDGFTAVNPRTVGERISAELRSEGTGLLVRAEELPELLGDLAKAYDAAPRRSDRSAEVRHIRGRAEIARRLAEVEADCRSEILIARPGPFSSDELGRFDGFTASGGTVRLLCSPGPGPGPGPVATDPAVQLRVLHEPLRGLHLYDRRIAVLPATADRATAAFIEDPATVDFLAALFERNWSRAEPATRDLVGRLLAQGLTQRAIASRLGLSERTVAAHISRLRELHDAETLFQLGWQMRGARD